jgi:hypothetical protein
MPEPSAVVDEVAAKDGEKKEAEKPSIASN